MQVGHNRYGTFYVPETFADHPGPRALLGGNVWQGALLEHITRDSYGEEWRGIVCGGAFLGDALPALSVCGEQVWAFEPNQHAYRACAETVEANELGNVAVFDCALGSGKEFRPLQTHAGKRSLGPASRLVLSPNANSNANSQIRTLVRRLDDVVRSDDPIDLIYLDVNGWESPALIGMERTLTVYRPILVLKRTPKDIFHWLCSLGYRCKTVVDGHRIYTAK